MIGSSDIRPLLDRARPGSPRWMRGALAFQRRILIAGIAAVVTSSGYAAPTNGQRSQDPGVEIEIRGRSVTIRHPEQNTPTGMARAVRERMIQDMLHESRFDFPDAIETRCLAALRSQTAEKTMQAVREYGRRLAAALHAVVVEGRDPDQVYDRLLKGIVRPEKWEAWRRRYDTAEAVRSLERQVQQGVRAARRRLEDRWKQDLRLYCLAARILALVDAPADPVTRRAILDRVWLTWCRQARIRVPGRAAFSLQQLGPFPFPHFPDDVRRLLDDAYAAGKIRVTLSPILLRAMADEPGYHTPVGTRESRDAAPR